MILKIGAIIFIGFSLKINRNDGILLLGVFSIVMIFLLWDWFVAKFENRINDRYFTITRRMEGRTGNYVRNGSISVTFLVFLGYFIFDIFGGEKFKFENFVAVGGLLFYILFCIIISGMTKYVDNISIFSKYFIFHFFKFSSFHFLSLSFFKFSFFKFVFFKFSFFQVFIFQSFHFF